MHQMYLGNLYHTYNLYEFVPKISGSIYVETFTKAV